MSPRQGMPASCAGVCADAYLQSEMPKPAETAFATGGLRRRHARIGGSGGQVGSARSYSFGGICYTRARDPGEGRLVARSAWSVAPPTPSRQRAMSGYRFTLYSGLGRVAGVEEPA